MNPENALEEWQMKTRSGYPLDLKIQMSLSRIRSWYEHHQGKVSVSYSGGKDSSVLLHLVRQLYPNTPAVFCDTGLEYPEIRRFARETENVIVLKPKMNFQEVVKKYGWPAVSKRNAQYIHEAGCGSIGSATHTLRLTGMTSKGEYLSLGKIPNKWLYLVDEVRAGNLKINHRCCHVMKKAPLHKHIKETGQYPYVGVTATESKDRELSWKRFGCNAYNMKNPMSRPLMAWTEQDILQYLLDNKLKMSSVYGNIVKDDTGKLSLTGVSRTGCMFCMFGAHMEKYPNRFEKMKKTHPKQWAFITQKMGGGKVLDLLKVPWGDPEDLSVFELIDS